MTVRAKDHPICTTELDVIEQRMERTTLGQMRAGIGHVHGSPSKEFREFGGSSESRFFLEGTHRWEFCRGETVSGITWLRFKRVEQL